MKTKPIKIVIWGGWYGSRNIGDRLLLITITDLLLAEFGAYELTILSAHPKYVHEYFNNSSLNKIKVIAPAIQVFGLIDALSSCDLLIFGGGVPFFSQVKQSVKMFFITSFMRLLRKPYHMWCVTCYPITWKISRFLYRTILNHSSLITCRDRFTRDEFLGLGINVDPVIIPDSVFSLNTFDEKEAKRLINKYVPTSQQNKIFALTPRNLREKNSEAQTHYTEKTKDDINHQLAVYSVAVEWLISHGYTPVFIPMNTSAPDDDRIAAKNIISKLKYPDKVFIIDEMFMPRAAPALYSLCQASLVSRVHGAVTSYLGNCPPIMYGFETKHIGIMESMNLSNQVFTLKSKPEEITSLLEGVLSNRNEICVMMQNGKLDLADKARIPLKSIHESLDQ